MLCYLVSVRKVVLANNISKNIEKKSDEELID